MGQPVRAGVFLAGALAVAALGAHPAAAEEGPLHVEDLEPVAVTVGHFYEGFFQNPSGVTCDPRSGEMYVADTARGLIGIFDARAAPLFSFGDPGRLEAPVKAIPDRRGRLLVLDANKPQRLSLYSYRGEFLSFVQPEELKARPAVSLTAFALDAEENLYLGDSGNGEILVFGPERRLSFRFGNRGFGRGEFTSIMGIAVTAQGIYVSDSAGLGVQVFDRRGRFLRGWGYHEAGRANVSFPYGIAVDAKGRIALADSLRHEIKLYQQDGKLIGQYGGVGRGLGDVVYPADLSFDGLGRLCVADRGNHRVQVLAPVLAAPGRSR